MKAFWLLVLLCLEANAGCSLLRWDGSKHYLLDEGGQPVTLFGHYYIGIPSSATAEPPVYNLSTYLTMLTANNHNCIRLWNPESMSGSAFDYLPWPRSGGAAPDGLNKFDLTSYESNWWIKFTNVIQTMDANNIYVMVMLHNGFSADVWSGGAGGQFDRYGTNLHNTAMNINGRVTSTNNWYSILDTTWVSYMTNYWRRVCDYVQPYKNVLLEVGNEMPTRSSNLTYYAATIVRDYEATLPRQHPIVISAMSALMLNSFTYQSNLITKSNVGAVLTPPGPITNNPPAITTSLMQLIDTDHSFGNINSGQGTVSNMCQSVTRGYAGYLNYDPSFWEPHSTGSLTEKAGLGYVRTALGYMNLSTAQPSNNYSSTGYALTNTFGQQLFFAPNKTAFTVTRPTGWLRYRWFDPETGAITNNYWLETSTTDQYQVPTPWTTTYGLLLVEPTTGAAGVEFGTAENDYIDCGGVTNTAGTSLTCAAWIMLNTNTLNVTGPRIMENGGTYFMISKTRLDFGSNTGDCYSDTNALVNLYQWYHVAATRSNTTYRVFIDGVQSSNSVTVSGGVAATGNWTIGNAPAANRGFIGWIRDCQVYNRVLSDPEIYALSKTVGPINTANLAGWWPLTDFGQGAAVDTLVYKDRSGNGFNGTAHKGTGGAMVQRLGGPQLARR